MGDQHVGYGYDEQGNGYAFIQTNLQHRDMASKNHTHEFLGTVKLAGKDDNWHSHRFSGVTSEAIPLPGGCHVHAIAENTDFYDHHHEVSVYTGPEVVLNPNSPYAEQKHVHFIEGSTTKDDGHVHRFVASTLIETPLLPVMCR